MFMEFIGVERSLIGRYQHIGSVAHFNVCNTETPFAEKNSES